MTKTLRTDKKEMNGVLLSFLLGMAGALAIFLPFLIVDKGFFLYCGDFNSQQIPFNYYMNGFLKEGGGTWSWATDLGSSAVNSYSFYNLGSPFLWFTMLFPTAWVPYLMVPMLIIKFGCISAAACLYLSRYAKTRNMAVITSLVYAFCGFNVYNVFFNHMLEPVIYFPLMLWALDGHVHEKRRGPLAVVLGLALLNSYFFFIGNAVFLLIYFFVKLACGEYKISLKNFFWLAAEVLIGVGIGMALALPAFYNLIGNPRTDNFANGFGLVFYNKVQQYANILSSMFLPPDPPYLPNLFTEGVIKWTSMSAFLPVVGMGGVLAYCMARKGGSVKKILFICLIMALVPILNSSFYAFNASYYARWFYMPLLMMAFATLRSLEDADIDLEKGARYALVITGVFVVFGLLPTKTDDGGWKIGVAQYASKFWLTFLLAISAAALFYILVRWYRRRVKFAPLLLAAVMGFSAFYSVIHIALGKFPQWERDADYVEQQYHGSALLNEVLPDDEGFYRIDAYEAHDNLGLWIGKSCLQTFNSVVTPSIMEFYPTVGVKRDVSSKPEQKEYALRGLLSVKYTIVPLEKESEFIDNEPTGRWTRWPQDVGPFAVYENDNFVPLGFTYDQYVRLDDWESIRVEDRSAILMRAIALDGEQEQEYGRLFSEERAVEWIVSEGSGASGGDAGDGEGPESSGWYSYDSVNQTAYFEDCQARSSESSYYTSADASGFSCGIVLEKENLVFFAVPYDEGFTATVNGEAAEVLKVSGGMMAVYAPAGENAIVFTYKTPGFGMGVLISIVALVALGLYIVGFHMVKQKEYKDDNSHTFAEDAADVVVDAEDENKAEITNNEEG